MPKDHKKIKPGQPMASREILGVNNTISARASRLATGLVKEMANQKRGSHEIRSAENLKAHVLDLNEMYKEEAKEDAINNMENVSLSPKDHYTESMRIGTDILEEILKNTTKHEDTTNYNIVNNIIEEMFNNITLPIETPTPESIAKEILKVLI